MLSSFLGFETKMTNKTGVNLTPRSLYFSGSITKQQGVLFHQQFSKCVPWTLWGPQYSLSGSMRSKCFS